MSSNTMRFEKLLEAVPDALVGMDQNGVIRFVNRQTELLFGFDREQLIGEPIDTLVSEALWEIYAQNRDEYFTDPKTRSAGLDLELVGRQQDGTEFPIDITLSHMETGDVLLVITAVRDVAGKQLAVKNAQLIVAIVEASDDAIVSITPDGIITSWNPAATRMYGYSREEIIGRPGRVMVEPDRADQVSDVLARVGTGSVVEKLEVNHVRKDGTVFPVSVTIAPISNADGVVVGACVVARDVTEQRRALETAQRMASIVKYSDDAIISRGLEDAITSWNLAAERMLGYSSEEIIGKSARLLIPEDRAGEVEAIGAKVRAGQPVEHLETTRVRRDGTLVPVSLTISPIFDEKGALIGASTIARDLTEQKRAEQVVEQDRDLLRATMDSLMDPHVLLEPVRDEAGGIVDFGVADPNPAACEYAGKTYDELIGMRLSDLFHDGAQPDSLVDQCSRVVQTGEPLTLDDIVYTQGLSGQENHFDIRVARVRDWLSYTWRDVTGRHKTAHRLAESEEHYRLLAENASDVVMRLSPDRRFEWVSGSVADVLGWAAPDLLGQVIDEFIDPEDRVPFRQSVAGTGPESMASTEFRFRRSDGSYRWVLCHTRLKADQDGAPVALVGGLIDIEARKAVEAHEMERLETLERFHRLTLGRELKMIELKKEIESLSGLVHKDGDENGDKH